MAPAHPQQEEIAFPQAGKLHHQRHQRKQQADQHAAQQMHAATAKVVGQPANAKLQRGIARQQDGCRRQRAALAHAAFHGHQRQKTQHDGVERGKNAVPSRMAGAVRMMPSQLVLLALSGLPVCGAVRVRRVVGLLRPGQQDARNAQQEQRTQEKCLIRPAGQQVGE
jgi:hypothetical protein